ncbi:hypothetical protein J4573_33830 [Actinomadura barringtoniae]|uniref:Integral membrane protein n=1 Tax=Actinomadura barringtoniae TaxID=1427535 RepID=A0A939TDA8_9ACTN|nr:DUF6350 family protein [Actinomadura barringtoniae]MBO2452110.1 hypothetical protein [Actinomadura barringtoniae]
MAPRPLYVAGLVGALWCIGIGLAVFTTITLIGWIAAPRTALGHGLPGVFRTAVNFWLVAHHAGFSVAHGRVGLLPLGVIVLPGALLYRSGGWMMRVTGVSSLPRRQRVGVVHVAVALAAPYAILSSLLALAAASKVVKASVWQALIACFVVAVLAGGLGAARAVVASGPNGRVRSGLGALLKLLPDRARSLVVGVAGSLAVLLAAGALLVGGSLVVHMSEAGRLYDELAPGIVGGVLLILVELAFLPNAIIWGMAYAIGPGFSVGAHTSVSPTGVFLDIVPAFPPLAALPEPGPAPLISLFAMAAPFVAGAVGGVLTVRAMPSPVYEAAPLWGFVSGAMTGAVAALLAALSGGPLGGGRMATMGPSAWQVGLLAALEVGISAAIAAWAANWLILRRPAKPANQKVPARKRRWRRSSPSTPRPAARTATTAAGAASAAAATAATSSQAEAAPPPKPAPAPHKSPAHGGDPLEFEEAEPVLAPRKPNRAKLRPGEPLPDLAEEIAEPTRRPKAESRPKPKPEPRPEPEPEPQPDTRWVKHEDILIEDPEPAPAPEPARETRPVREPEPQSERDDEAVPPPREDPGRTENRGGAIYVLREDPQQD